MTTTTPTPSSAAPASTERVRHLVVDSGAIIKEVPLHSLADRLWTVPDVIEEIKDKRARHVLQSLPKKIELREPSPESIQFIVDFSRRTGDFRSISDADIKVLALCYELEKAHNGTARLNRLPYRELHTSDDGKPLFVCHRRHRQRAAPDATIEATMGALQKLVEQQYSLKKKNMVGMGNKFHKSAVLAMVKHYSAVETISILEQYRREISAQGREKGVQPYRIGQWFSGQLKLLANQLKSEKAAVAKAQEEAAAKKKAAAEQAAKEPLTGAAAMRALAKARRAESGRAWGPASSGKNSSQEVDPAAYPKLRVTAASHEHRVGTRVNVLSLAAAGSTEDAAPFVSGTVAATNLASGTVTVHLDWKLADGRAPTLYAPASALVAMPSTAPTSTSQRRVHFMDSADVVVNTPSIGESDADEVSPSLANEASQTDIPTAQPDAPVASAHAPAQEVKSRILSMGAGLSSTVTAEDVDDSDDTSWVTPENIGSHIGHGGFTKAFHTVDVIPAVGCITTDFAMQNVMLQVGLNLVSAGGVRIDRVRQWVLYCGACFHEMRDMERLFCAKCGSAGVSKLAVSLTRQGKLKRHFSSNRKVKLQGERYSLPKPKGGRKLDLLLREDQLMAGGWRQQANKKGLSHSFMGEHVLGSLGMRVGAGSNVVVGMGRSNPNAKRGRERRGKKKRTKAVHGGKGSVR